ncbi:type II secretion system protein N [Marinobacter sp.]|uniref:type II secretion system protein N n=1 Tax=Marinobacter sp. TaxID=50741 RepID=UPI000C638824|nr:type II secretion system protein N [Marinobacter sp.]MBE93903.1 general secretion pathway protein GspC [Marinobacter sp.]MBE94452.1 general secretion pathway protein GspC [Marinobacter sp.]|tara:strand:+ start:1532 stop:2374 length:843 start_codon:yes stop_codon:yes gene_type:complete
MAAVTGSRRLPRLLANLLLVGLVVYVALVLARTTWLIAWDDRPVAMAPALDSRATVSGGGRLQPLAAHQVFGRAEEQPRVAEVVRRSAPETRLNLRLEGVLVAERPEDSGAIVAGSNGVTEHYRVGDILPGNAELAEVEPGRVLIRRNGQYETLTFEEQLSTSLVEGVEESSASSPEQFLSEAREQLGSQGVAALAPYGLSPTGEGGTSGYVYDGSNAMLNAVNLQAGDVITAVNGQRLGDLEQDMMLFENWRSEPQLEIEIERDGSILTVSYAIPEQWR